MFLKCITLKLGPMNDIKVAGNTMLKLKKYLQIYICIYICVHVYTFLHLCMFVQLHIYTFIDIQSQYRILLNNELYFCGSSPHFPYM